MSWIPLYPDLWERKRENFGVELMGFPAKHPNLVYRCLAQANFATLWRCLPLLPKLFSLRFRLNTAAWRYLWLNFDYLENP